ncbi:MAG: amino-acid N-acetyltransferase [Pseudomonadota bacterium]|nr:amino-acid N-acetyltransferase [Pseudomonadota bacterium]
MDNFIKWFRGSSPYINAHRGRTFVICFGGEAAVDDSFVNLAQDIRLLANLGVRLILVHGAEPQIAQELARHDLTLPDHDGQPIADETTLQCVKAAVGTLRIDIEACFSSGLSDTPLATSQLRLVSGNFVVARPLGILNGVDHLHTGLVRRSEAAAIRSYLDDGAIVLLPPLGYSPTGETFLLQAHDVATHVASALEADKLLFLTESEALNNDSGQTINELTPGQAAQLKGSYSSGTEQARQLNAAIRACQAGVRRVHLVPRRQDGALLQELYTRDGVGTMITAESYDTLRSATIDDVGGILALIAPLENEGILVHRDREQLELEIGNFAVMERDGVIVACAALYGYPPEPIGEIACVAVHADYRQSGRGRDLLEFLAGIARERGIERLFVLTTQTAHWFVEQGFQPARIQDLPVAKQSLYNYQRNSKAFMMPLGERKTRKIHR